MSDVHAEHAPEAPMDPTDPWGTLGAHVVTARGARRACGGGGVSVRSLLKNTSLYLYPRAAWKASASASAIVEPTFAMDEEAVSYTHLRAHET